VRIVDTVVEVNKARKKAMAERVIQAMGGSVRGKTIGVLGLAFKPNTDDMRDAPALDIIPALQAAGARIKAYDPESMHEAGKMLTEVDFCDGPYHAVDGADAMVLITEWDQFRAIDFDRVKKMLKSPVVVDLRNVYQPSDMAKRGFRYVSIGRPAAGG
jgi:UDPglucose 6-dehydrogenase